MVIIGIILIILLIISGYFLTKCGPFGGIILGLGAIGMAITGGWIGGLIWGFAAWTVFDRMQKES